MSGLKNEGWSHPSNAKKWHYFRDMRSLCGKWGVLIHPPAGYEDDTDSPDNCVDCSRRRKKERDKCHKAVEG